MNSSDRLLLAVDRDGARQLFGCRQSGQWDVVIDRLLEESQNRPGSRCLLDPTASALRRLLTAAPPLDASLPDSTPLATTDRRSIYLVRPDLVARLAEAWQTLDVAELLKGGVVADDKVAAERLAELKRFYQQAAGDGCAVICLASVSEVN
ncbi:MAG: hypothetical protein U0795_24700 [Pirellulales bacterium]